MLTEITDADNSVAPAARGRVDSGNPRPSYGRQERPSGRSDDAGAAVQILILGGGVVGITTAYQLQKDGHAVTVLEQGGQVAEGASWGNAGMIAPGHTFVWSSPAAPAGLLTSLFLKDQALRSEASREGKESG